MSEREARFPTSPKNFWLFSHIKILNLIFPQSPKSFQKNPKTLPKCWVHNVKKKEKYRATRQKKSLENLRNLFLEKCPFPLFLVSKPSPLNSGPITKIKGFYLNPLRDNVEEPKQFSKVKISIHRIPTSKLLNKTDIFTWLFSLAPPSFFDQIPF